MGQKDRCAIVDATIMAVALPQQEQGRETQSRAAASRERQQYYFNIKANIGVYTIIRLAHSVSPPQVNVNNVIMDDHLVRKNNPRICNNASCPGM
jgi:hypothetical protein